MLDLLFTLLKLTGWGLLILLATAAVYLLRMYIKYTVAIGRLEQMKKDNPDFITILPHSYKFIMGWLYNFIEYAKDFDSSDEPIPLTNNYIHMKMAESLGESEFNAANHPVTATQQFGQVHFFVQDPQMAQDLFTTKNIAIDKTGETEMMFKDLLGNSFLFSKGDDLWKAKRKACSHAFYKDRLESMLDVLKGQIMKKFDVWVKEIEASPEGRTQIDMAVEFERIFSRNIITISLGEDISDQPIEI